MTTDVVIRNATLADVPAITSLWIELMDFHSKRDAFFTRGKKGHEAAAQYITRGIQNPDRACVLVGELGGDILGYCYAVINEYLPVFDAKFYGSIVDLSVTTGARRHHLGQRLVDQILNWFKIKGITRVDVTVAKKNEISTKFWRKMGFGDFKEILFRNI